MTEIMNNDSKSEHWQLSWTMTVMVVNGRRSDQWKLWWVLAGKMNNDSYGKQCQ